ncbi:CHRD domain-containing protein [Cesiribacter andamanensis]|uniref:CHRD domain protein n=1 Tax=Cesiribacter andamanensis AMV16 TaxID=1279009 RepID=M7P2K5_9BACT|nr:CHRD domain-containing protein [Cesiribacter andamanensis]EMR04764.1 CHRD domain protein [Cesiribacter andamanensis AMV16]
MLDDAVGAKGGQQVLNFRTHLSGDQEVPANASKATGQAIFQLSKDGTELHYKLIVANLDNVLMAHIHVAPAGDNGGVVAWLYPAGPPPNLIPGTTNGILAQGTITSANLVGSLAGMDLSDLVALMLNGNTYVNVHTQQYPGGEIRGQIWGNSPHNAW